MKKVFRILVLLFFGILLIVGLAASFIHFSGLPSYPVEMSEDVKKLNVSVDSSHVAKGEKIASMLCVNCHSGTDNRLVGKRLLDIPKEFGEIYSYNITQDKVHGIGNWTDGELMYFLRTGIKSDGRYIPPYMPKYPLMSDDDLKSVIAWLRSDRRNVQAAEEEQRENKPNFLVKLLTRTVIKPMPFLQGIEEPDSNSKVEHGRYLATAVYGCFSCHSKDFKTNNDLHPERSEGFFGGGNPLLDLDGKTIVSPNITFDKTGIAHYNLEQFIDLIHNGRKPDGSLIRYPMMPHTLLTQAEVENMYDYLKTVPKLANNN